MITLSWTAPSQPNVVIRNYTVFYHHSEDLLNAHNETFGPDVFNYTVDVLGGATYWFNVRAETIKPGENASLIVNIPEYSKCNAVGLTYLIDVNEKQDLYYRALPVHLVKSRKVK